MTFGQAMVKQRLKLGISQRELEFHTGIRHSTLAAYELEAGWPQLDNAIKISRVLRFSLDGIDPVLLPKDQIVTYKQLKRISDLESELGKAKSELPVGYYNQPLARIQTPQIVP